MNDIPEIYCEFSFLEKVFSQNRIGFVQALIQNSEEVEGLMACYHILNQPSIINVDISADLAKNAENVIFKQLIKNPTIRIICRDSKECSWRSNSFFNNKMLELFMLDIPDKEVEKIEKEHGLMILSPENIKQKLPLLSANPLISVIKRERKFRWEDLSYLNHHCHSVFVIDNYLIDGSKDKLKVNLIPAIKSLIKSNLKKRKLHFTLFIQKAIPDLKQIDTNLRVLLNEYMDGIEIRIVKMADKANHDRYIFTNLVCLMSGTGVNILSRIKHSEQQEINQNTSIMIYPLYSTSYESSEINESCRKRNYDAIIKIIKIYGEMDVSATEKIGSEIRAVGPINESFYKSIGIKC